MSGIFISYRREDSQGEALHLFDDLKGHFGADRVFMDVTRIDPGKDFRKAIESAVSSCNVLIAMIGKEWLDASDESKKRRLEDPKDFVRLEIGSALRREDVNVIPVLVQGAVMPRPEQLPTELEDLVWRNAFELRHNRWDVDVTELVKGLEKIVPVSRGDSEQKISWKLSKISIALLVIGFTVVIGALLQLGVLKVGPPSPPILPSNEESVGEKVPNFGVVFGSDTSIDAARDEIARASKNGIPTAKIYFRNGYYASIAGVDDKPTAQKYLAIVKNFRPDAYITSMAAWCPNPKPRNGFTECQSSQ